MLSNLVIQAMLVALLGAGMERDSLFVAMSVPLFLNTLTSSSIGMVATPTILAYTDQSQQHHATDRMLRSVAIVAVLTGIFFYVFRDELIGALAPGFEMRQRIITSGLCAITLAIIPLQAVTAILSGFWLAVERVLLPSLSLLLGNALTIGIMVWCGQRLTASLSATAYLAGVLLVCLVQAVAYYSRRHKTCKPASVPVDNDGTRSLLKQSSLLMLIGTVSRSNSLVERRIASDFSGGTISCLGYAGYIVSFLVNATTAPTASAYYSKLCRLWNEGNRVELHQFFEKGLSIVIICCLGVIGIVLLLFSEMFGIVLPWTKLTLANAHELSTYVKILMPGYLFLAASSFISRIFYISGRFVLAALLDCIGLFVYLGAAYWLSRHFGAYGLALATSLYAMCLGLLIYFVVRNIYRFSFSKNFWRPVGLFSFVWCLGLWLGWVTKIQVSKYTLTLTAAGIGAFVYFAIILSVFWMVTKQDSRLPA
jgi:putative peptidoglycan lipid II flippase